MGGFLTQLPLKKSGIEIRVRDLARSSSSTFAMPARQHAILIILSARSARFLRILAIFALKTLKIFWRRGVWRRLLSGLWLVS